MQSRRIEMPCSSNPGDSQSWSARKTLGKMSKVVGLPLSSSEGLNVLSCLSLHFEPFLGKSEPVSETASREYLIEKALMEKNSKWD